MPARASVEALTQKAVPIEQTSPQWLSPGQRLLESSTSLAEAVAVVQNFVPTEAAQALSRQRMLQFANEHPDALSRTCSEGHFTASAWLVNATATAGLVLLHTKVGRWLQPGGHADGNACLAAVALRECTEETGIAGLAVWSQPVDIDVHVFRNRQAPPADGQHVPEPDHLHLDVRYVVRAPSGASFSGNHESQGLRWVTENELNLPELNLDEGALRLARSGFATARAALAQDV